VKVKRWMPWAALVAAAGVLVVAGGAAARPDGSAVKAQKTFRLGLVTDIGGLNDRSFNFLANQGRLRAQKELKFQTRVLISKSNADYVPNLASLAQQDYDLVIAVGFLMAESINTVAQRFPETNFGIIDVSQPTLKDKPSNVLGLIFREQEAGCLVGSMAALHIKSKGGQQVISSVGGIKIPPVDRFIAGYQWCAKKVNRPIRTLNGYSQDFVDQAKCQELALNQIDQGSQVVFQVAGQCGLGALSAAKQKGKLGIGVDANQFYLGNHIMTSAQKKVDVAVYSAANLLKTGKFKGGRDQTFTVKNGGIDYGKPARVSKAIISQVERIKKQIAAGKYGKIPTTVQ